MGAEPPTGTVTFLTMVVDHAGPEWERPAGVGAVGDWQDDAVVQAAIERHGGFVFTDRAAGMMAAFATAVDAAEAAIELQAGLIARHDQLGCGACVGLHTGEAAAGERDYAGPEVNRAARLASLAHAGQIVVSETTELLLRDRMALRALGDFRLHDLNRRMTVHQLVADDLPSEFPPLRRTDPRSGNLPEQPTSFVGRDALLVEVADLVRSNRLVTLGGAGGIGKTRLAIEVGAGLCDDFPDGVWFVELASVGAGDAASVTAAIATALGIIPRGDSDLIETVAEVLSTWRALVVIDNCEHVLPAVSAAVTAILAMPGSARVLATSREYLWVTGETLVEVTPLVVEGGVTSDAGQLFVERARTVRATFGLQDPETAAAVDEICRTLDGLPLGIELAAARMAAMSAIEVRDRLSARFRLLRGTPAQPDRQQTLLRAVGWSYDLLDADEQQLLRNAAVFSGGFDLASLSAVADSDDVDVLDQLDSLVGKSMIVADHGVIHTRYRLYETIRQFAEDRLIEAGSRDRMADRHARYFADAAVERWGKWNGPGWRGAVDWVEVELGNLRASFRWSRQRSDLVVATDIAAHAALMGFSIEQFETVAWAEELAAAVGDAAVPRLPRLLTAAGYACFVGRAEVATANAHRAVELEARPGYEPCEPGYATFIEALGQVYCGHLDRYVELTGVVASEFGSDRGYGLASYVDGLQASGRVDEALALVDESVAAARQLGNPYWIAYALWIAGLALSKPEPKRALATWDDAVEHVREHGVHFFDAFLARDAARLHASHGDADRALLLFDTALRAAHRAGNIPQVIITLASVPELLERLDRDDSAMTLYGALSKEPDSFHHVPDLPALGERIERRLGAERAAALRLVGEKLDLNEAVAWTQEELASVHRERRTQAGDERPAGLSPREIEVLRLVAAGRTTGDIATKLFISAKTADHHIQHIYTKIGASNRAAATRWALEHRIDAQR